jgi:hypothetical protein
VLIGARTALSPASAAGDVTVSSKLAQFVAASCSSAARKRAQPATSPGVRVCGRSGSRHGRWQLTRTMTQVREHTRRRIGRGSPDTRPWPRRPLGLSRCLARGGEPGAALGLHDLAGLGQLGQRGRDRRPRKPSLGGDPGPAGVGRSGSGHPRWPRVASRAGVDAHAREARASSAGTAMTAGQVRHVLLKSLLRAGCIAGSSTAAIEMLYRQRCYFERERENPAVPHTSDASVTLADRTTRAGYLRIHRRRNRRARPRPARATSRPPVAFPIQATARPSHCSYRSCAAGGSLSWRATGALARSLRPGPWAPARCRRTPSRPRRAT